MRVFAGGSSALLDSEMSPSVLLVHMRLDFPGSSGSTQPVSMNKLNMMVRSTLAHLPGLGEALNVAAQTQQICCDWDSRQINSRDVSLQNTIFNHYSPACCSS